MQTHGQIRTVVVDVQSVVLRGIKKKQPWASNDNFDLQLSTCFLLPSLQVCIFYALVILPCRKLKSLSLLNKP